MRPVFVMRAVPLDAMAEKLWLTMIRDGLLAERRILASSAWIGRREP
jgi:hypothetical protein